FLSPCPATARKRPVSDPARQHLPSPSRPQGQPWRYSFSLPAEEGAPSCSICSPWPGVGTRMALTPISSHVFRTEVPMFSRPFLCQCLALVTSLVLFGASPAEAQKTYFGLMFGSQQTPPDPNHAHSFATFVRVSCNGPQPGQPVIEAHTI